MGGVLVLLTVYLEQLVYSLPMHSYSLFRLALGLPLLQPTEKDRVACIADTGAYTI